MPTGKPGGGAIIGKAILGMKPGGGGMPMGAPNGIIPAKHIGNSIINGKHIHDNLVQTIPRHKHAKQEDASSQKGEKANNETRQDQIGLTGHRRPGHHRLRHAHKSRAQHHGARKAGWRWKTGWKHGTLTPPEVATERMAAEDAPRSSCGRRAPAVPAAEKNIYYDRRFVELDGVCLSV